MCLGEILFIALFMCFFVLVFGFVYLVLMYEYMKMSGRFSISQIKASRDVYNIKDIRINMELPIDVSVGKINRLRLSYFQSIKVIVLITDFLKKNNELVKYNHLNNKKVDLSDDIEILRDKIMEVLK